MGAGCFKPKDDWDGDPPYHGGVRCGNDVQAHTTANGVQFGQAPHADDFFKDVPAGQAAVSIGPENRPPATSHEQESEARSVGTHRTECG